MWRKGLFLLIALLAVGSMGALPALAQGSATWTAQYYNNTNLQDPIVLQRTEGALAFNWGSGSPGPGVNPDNFSVRFAADPFFEAATYRFFVLADDAVRLNVGFAFQPQLDTIGAAKVGQIQSVDIAMPGGNRHVQLDYQEFGGDAYVYIQWFNLRTNPNPSPTFPVGQGGGSIPPGSGGIIPVGSAPWTVQYYANPNLVGTPSAILSEASPKRDWGAGSPVASIPADNWSARWTSTQTVPAGTYVLQVRADDGVRVLIDGITYINQWGTATGQTYTVNVPLGAGQHVFLVEFFEANGNAFLDYNFGLLSAPTLPTQPPVITGAFATVTGAFRLNVRNLPSAVRTQVLTKINRNESYPIVGRNTAGTWWQLNVNGIVGWVNARFVTAQNAQNVPITDGQGGGSVPPGTITCSTAPAPRLTVGGLGRVTQGLPNNIRSITSSSGTLLGQIPSGAAFNVLEGPFCSEGFYWWRVNYNGVVGFTPEGGSGQYWLEPI